MESGHCHLKDASSPEDKCSMLSVSLHSSTYKQVVVTDYHKVRERKNKERRGEKGCSGKRGSMFKNVHTPTIEPE